MRKRRVYYSNNDFLNAHGGGSVHGTIGHPTLGGTGGGFGTPTTHNPKSNTSSPPSTLGGFTHGGGGQGSTLSPSQGGGVSSLGGVGVVGVGGLGYGAGSLFGGMPYYSPFIDTNMGGEWTDAPNMDANNIPTADGKPALQVVLPKSGKWAEKKYQWLVVEVPATEAGLHRVIWGKKEDDSMVDMRKGQMAIQTSEYSLSDNQSPMQDYHYAEGDTAPVVTKLPFWKKALPLIGVVTGMTIVWYLDKHQQEWLKGHRTWVGVGLTVGVIACSIPLVMGNKKITAAKASISNPSDNQKIADILNQITSTRKIAPEDTEKAITWIGTNLSDDEKRMLIDFYTTLNKIPVASSPNDAAAVYTSAVKSLNSKYSASDVAIFMKKIIPLNAILKTN